MGGAGPGCALPQPGEAVGGGGAEGRRFTRQCATSAATGPVLAACQSTTPDTRPRRHSTLPGWKSPCSGTAGPPGTGPQEISAACCHTLG